MTRRDGLIGLSGALLLLSLSALFYPLARGETLFWGLPALQFYPWRQLAFDQIAQGQLPSWNPYVGGGAPLLANYQTAVFYPPNWIMLLLPDTVAMSVLALAHVLWAGAGMWWFAGQLGLSNFGRGISALSFALSGYLIARLGSFPTANAGAWMPWLFLTVHQVIIRHSAASVGWLALVLGLNLAAGHAQTTWYSALGAGVYGLWRLLWAEHRTPWQTRGFALGMTLAGTLLGVALAAIQLLPTVEYLRESHRSSGLDFAVATNLSYNPLRLVTLFNPNFFGTPADGSYITKGIFFEDAAYIGFVPVIAALAALVARRTYRRELSTRPDLHSVPFWALLAAATLLIAMGQHGPVFRWLYTHVPTFDAFREPVRWLILTEFSLAILAGIGIETWGRGPRIVFWSRLAAAGGAGMALLALGFAAFGSADSREITVLARGLAIVGAGIVMAALLTLAQPIYGRPGMNRSLWRAIVLIVVTLDLTWAAVGLNPTVPDDFFDPLTDQQIAPFAGRLYWFEDAEQAAKFEQHFVLSDYRVATQNWQAVRASLLPNMTMLDDVMNFTNDDPFQPRYHQQFVEIIEDLGTASGALLRAAGITRVMGLQPAGWTVSGSGAPTTAETTYETDPLAWLVPEAIWIEDEQTLRAALRDPGWDPEQVVYLAGQADGSTVAPDGAGGRVTTLEHESTRRRYRVSTDGPAYLVLSTSWYPGWRATLNGQTTTLIRANLAFMAVRVPAGDSEIWLDYHLTGWPWAAAITGMAAAISAGLILANRRGRRS